MRTSSDPAVRFVTLGRILNERPGLLAARYGLFPAPAALFGLSESYGTISFAALRTGRHELPLAIPDALPYQPSDEHRACAVRLVATATARARTSFGEVPPMLTDQTAFLLLEGIGLHGRVPRQVALSGKVISSHLRFSGHLVAIPGIDLPLVVAFADPVRRGEQLSFFATLGTIEVFAPSGSISRLALLRARRANSRPAQDRERTPRPDEPADEPGKDRAEPTEAAEAPETAEPAAATG